MPDRDEIRALVRQEIRQAVDAVIREQWDRGTSALGKWLLRAVAGAILAAVVKLALHLGDKP